MTVSAKSLLPGELFISYHLLPGDGVLAMVADHTGPLASHDLGQVPGLAQAVTALRLSAASPKGALVATDSNSSGVDNLRWSNRSGEVAWGVAPKTLLPCGAPQAEAAVAASTATEEVEAWWPGATARPIYKELPCRPLGAVSVRPQEAWPAIGRQLAATLLQPILLEASFSKLVISPDGALWALPWELLLQASDSQPKQQAVVLVHSLGHLAHVRERRVHMAASKQADRLLAIGDPDYPGSMKPAVTRSNDVLRTGRIVPRSAANQESAQAPQWPRLPYSRQEVQRIATGFGRGRVRLLTGHDASEASLRRMARDGGLAAYSHLVFSVHGYFDPELPDGAGIVLTATGDNSESDGYVTVSDIARLSLRSRLTLLSACNTARGERDFIEGHTGLSYALSWAGSDATVAALWPVSDRGTAAFSVRLFERVRQGMAPSKALAAVKREFQASADPVLNSPSTWAAFVLHGD